MSDGNNIDDDVKNQVHRDNNNNSEDDLKASETDANNENSMPSSQQEVIVFAPSLFFQEWFSFLVWECWFLGRVVLYVVGLKKY